MAPFARAFHILVTLFHGIVAALGVVGAASLGPSAWMLCPALAAAAACAAGVALAVVTSPGLRLPLCRPATARAVYELYLLAAVLSWAGAISLCFMGVKLLRPGGWTGDGVHLADGRPLPTHVVPLALAIMEGAAVTTALTPLNACVARRLLPEKAAGGTRSTADVEAVVDSAAPALPVGGVGTG